MLTKDDIRDALLKECDICVHLFGKLPEGESEYRPSPVQRNTLELLRYLAHCGISGARVVLEGSFEPFHDGVRRTASMPAVDFPAAMERQKRDLAEFFARLTHEQFSSQEAKLPTGETVKLGRALLDAPLRWMIGYRMQLFLYAKASGNHAIGTANCWAGIDWPKR